MFPHTHTQCHRFYIQNTYVLTTWFAKMTKPILELFTTGLSMANPWTRSKGSLEKHCFSWERSWWNFKHKIILDVVNVSCFEWQWGFILIIPFPTTTFISNQELEWGCMLAEVCCSILFSFERTSLSFNIPHGASQTLKCHVRLLECQHRRTTTNYIVEKCL